MPPGTIAPPSLAERQFVILSGLTRSQAKAATLQGAVLALAGAGAGKTRTLTAGVASRIAARGICPSRTRRRNGASRLEASGRDHPCPWIAKRQLPGSHEYVRQQ